MPEENATSADIVSGIYKGNTDFESLLVKKYSRTVLYIIEKRCGDPELAKDICQETFLVLLQKFRKRTLEDPEKLASYIRKTAINILIADKRKETRRQTFPDSEAIDNSLDQSPTQLDDLEKSCLRKAVTNSILSIKNQRDREILYRFYIKEHEKSEICEQLDIDFRHFDKVISRARNRLRDSMIKVNNETLEGVDE